MGDFLHNLISSKTQWLTPGSTTCITQGGLRRIVFLGGTPPILPQQILNLPEPPRDDAANPPPHLTEAESEFTSRVGLRAEWVYEQSGFTCRVGLRTEWVYVQRGFTCRLQSRFSRYSTLILYCLYPSVYL